MLNRTQPPIPSAELDTAGISSAEQIARNSRNLAHLSQHPDGPWHPSWTEYFNAVADEIERLTGERYT